MNASPGHSKFWSFQHIFFLLVFTLLCFWPLTFGLFSAKNDNITQFLPIRYHVSEALRSGHLPLWTPFMYLGYPIHGDMQGGAWNPVVWVLSFFDSYNLATLHAEILLYVFVAGLGMYRLLRAVGVSQALSLAGGSAYLMCGYITDVAGSNLPFLAAAAYTPFVFAYFFDLLTKPSLSYALKTSIFLSLLFVSAYPSFFICTAYVLFTALCVVFVKLLRQKNGAGLRRLAGYQLVVAAIFLLLSGPAILSYWQILPYYERGQGVTLNQALENSFHPSCIVSFLFPTAPIRNPASFATDLISRNAYFNLLVVIFLLCYAFTKKTAFQNLVLAGMVFFFLFSLGRYTPLREWCYHLLPLMNTFRHPANARLFVIIAGLVLGITVFQNFVLGSLSQKYLRLVLSISLLAVATIVFFSFSNVSIGNKIVDFYRHSIDYREALKVFFQSLTLNEVVVINGAAQIVFLGLFFLLLRKPRSEHRLASLLVINSFIFAQFVTPYTLASKTSPGSINRILKGFPSGFPKPDETKTIAVNSFDSHSFFELIGLETFYSKKISLSDTVYTPTFMTATAQILANTSKKNYVLSHPYAYFSNSEKQLASFALTRFWNNGFQFSVAARDSCVFFLQQLYLPGWKCFIDGKKATMSKTNETLISTTVPGGTHFVKFVYRPFGVFTTFIISVFTSIIIMGFLTKKYFSEKRSKK